jgi:hypothetical protein
VALDLEAELAAANANLRRLREETIAELTDELAAETNPYTREFLQGKIERVRKIGVKILGD